MVSASRKPLTYTDALGSSLSTSKSDLLSCLMENQHFSFVNSKCNFIIKIY